MPHKPQLVVLDVNLPDMSGIDVCRQIKADPATAHVIVLHLSATSVGVDNKVAGLASGCDGYLTEPVDAEELIAHVNALLRLKRAEEELRETNATLRALFDALPLAVMATDPDGRVTRWSPSAARVFGWSEEDVIGGLNPTMTPKAEAEYASRVKRALAGESIVGFETLMRRKDGTTVPVAVSLGPVRTKEGAISGTLAVVEDITARKLAEREMARLYQEAGRAGRVKDEFLATLSHELRTPLNAMRVWVHLLRRGEVPPDRIDSALEIIDRNTTAQVRLIEDILDVSRIVSGKLRLQYLPVDLRRVVAAAADMVRPVAASRNQDLLVDAGDQPVLVIGDNERLQQVVTNLLSNGGEVHAGRRDRVGLGHRRRSGGVDSKCATRASASTPHSCRTSSSGSPRPTARPHAFTEGSALAWRSSATWWSCMGAACRRTAPASARGARSR